MRDALIIAQRELGSYFLSPIAYIFGGFFLGSQMLVSVFMSGGGLVQNASADASNFFGILSIVLAVFLPALSMRTWAEERKLGTLELLMTFPVRSVSLIAGKVIAALVFLTIVLGLTLIYPLTLAMFAEPGLDWGPVIGAYLGSILLATAYLAVGMFFSAITRDQILAFAGTLALLLPLAIGGTPFVQFQLRGVMPEWLLWLPDVLDTVSPYKYFGSIARGVIDTRDLILFASFAGFFLYVNYLTLQLRRHKG